MSDRLLSKIIGQIKNDMNEHAHGAMNITADVAKFNEMAGAYRGMQHCLDVIDNALREDDEAEQNS